MTPKQRDLIEQLCCEMNLTYEDINMTDAEANETIGSLIEHQRKCDETYEVIRQLVIHAGEDK
jgi:hypothetical protein